MADGDADSRAIRRALIDTLQRDGHVHSPRVAAAMLAVPRETFLPGVALDDVYRAGDAIVTKRLDGVSVSSASAPEVVALMLEQLDVRPGNRVLEIGAGTGYNAALLAHLAGEEGQVVTVEIDEDLVISAREHLIESGYDRVLVVHSDGALGYPSDRPYDRIILTVASSDIAPAWCDQLARPDGRLVLPLSLRGPQRTVAFTPTLDHLASESVWNCSFIPLRGVLASGSVRLPLGPDGGLVLAGVEEPLPLKPEEIPLLLRAPVTTIPTGLRVNSEQVRDGLHLWLVAHQTGVCTLWGGPLVPDLFGMSDRTGVHGTLCMLDAHGLVLLGWLDEPERSDELAILVPAGGEALAERVQVALQGWDLASRPRDSDLSIRAYAHGHGPPADASAGEVALKRRWSRLLLKWRH